MIDAPSNSLSSSGRSLRFIEGPSLDRRDLHIEPATSQTHHRRNMSLPLSPFPVVVGLRERARHDAPHVEWNNAFFNRLSPVLDGNSPRTDVPDPVATGAIPAYAAKWPADWNALKSPAIRRIWDAVATPTPGIDVKT